VSKGKRGKRAAPFLWFCVTFRCTASHACREIGRGKERLHYPGAALHFVARRLMPAVKSDAARSGCTILVLRYISLHGVICLP